MNQLLTWLSGGDLRSDGTANEVSQFVLDNPQVFEDLYAALFAEDDVVRGRAADALEKVARRRPDLLLEHLPEVINLSKVEDVPMVKMHLAMIFGHLAVYPEMIEELVTALNDLLDDGSVFTRSWAIVSLCIIAREYPQKCQAVLDKILSFQKDESIAVRTKVKKAINLLTAPQAKYPKGWIKSELLLKRWSRNM